MMMTTAAPAISNVSVEIPVPGVGATVGEGDTVTGGVTVGATVEVGATVWVGWVVGCAAAALTVT